MNVLHHLAEFRAALANYHPSQTAKQTLAEANLALLVGPSSSGRNTIINELLKTDSYYFLVSDTTRRPRVNNGIPEQNGREYWFRTEDEVLAEIQRGEFVEAAIIHDQQVSGTSIREIHKAHQLQKTALTEVEVVGANHIHQLKPDTTLIFVLPPSFEVWMERLHNRGAMPAQEVRSRLETACQEFRAALDHDYYHFVVNDKLEYTVATVDAIIRHQKVDAMQESRGHELARSLLAATEKHLREQQSI